MLPYVFRILDTELVFPGFEGPFNTMICTIKFVIQRLGGGGVNIRALKVRPMKEVRGYPPPENFEN